jgi:hypothetical protein
VNGEGVDGEFRVEGAESVNVVNHGQKKRWRERGMSSQPMEVVSDRDARGGSEKDEQQVRHAQTKMLQIDGKFPELLHTSSETVLGHRLKCELRHWWQSTLPACVQSARPCARPGKTHICWAKRGEAVPRAWLVSALEEMQIVGPEPEPEPEPQLEPHRNSKPRQQALEMRPQKQKPQRWRQVDAC